MLLAPALIKVGPDALAKIFGIMLRVRYWSSCAELRNIGINPIRRGIALSSMCCRRFLSED